MKLFLDDRRPAPDCSWTVVQTLEAIALLKTGEVEGISFDHDLGLIEEDDSERTGNGVFLWIEEQVGVVSRTVSCGSSSSECCPG